MKVTTALFGHTEKDEIQKPKSQTPRVDESVARRIQREAIEKGNMPSNIFKTNVNVSDREARWKENAEIEKSIYFNDVMSLYNMVKNLQSRMVEFGYRSIEYKCLKICLVDINTDFVNYGFDNYQKVEVNLWVMGTNVNINIQCFTNECANIGVVRYSEKPNAVLYDSDIWMSDYAITQTEEMIRELVFASSKDVYDYIFNLVSDGTMTDPIVNDSEFDDTDELIMPISTTLDKFRAIFPQQHNVNWYSISLNTDVCIDGNVEFKWLLDYASLMVRSRTNYAEMYDLRDWLDSYLDNIVDIQGCIGFDGVLEHTHNEDVGRQDGLTNAKINELKHCKEYVLKILELEKNMSDKIHQDGNMLIMPITNGKTLKTFIDMFGQCIGDYHNEDVIFDNDLYENAYNVIKADKEYKDRKEYEDYMGDFYQ